MAVSTLKISGAQWERFIEWIIWCWEHDTCPQYLQFEGFPSDCLWSCPTGCTFPSGWSILDLLLEHTLDFTLVYIVWNFSKCKQEQSENSCQNHVPDLKLTINTVATIVCQLRASGMQENFLAIFSGIANATFHLEARPPTLLWLKDIERLCFQRTKIGFCICAIHYFPEREKLKSEL